MRRNSPDESTPFSVKVAPPPPAPLPAKVKFQAILQPACGSFGSTFGNGSPTTNSGFLPVALSFSPHVASSSSYLPSLAAVRSQNFLA